jgi:hypothetical protein
MSTIIEIANTLGGAQPEMIDAMFNENHGTLFRAIPFKQVNGWMDRFTRTVGKPTVSFRNLGEGVGVSGSKRVPYAEGIFLLSGASEVDKIEADTDPRGALEYRREQDLDFLGSMGETLSAKTFYGSHKKDDGFDGLFTRLPASADTFVSARGADEGASIYAIKFGPKKFMGLYNNAAGGQIIDARDYGALTEKVGDKIYELYRTMFNAGIGFSQYHPKAIGRIGKITSAKKPTFSHFSELFGKMGGKPDLLITTWNVLGYINELKQEFLQMTPGDKNLDVQVGLLNGVPVIVDSALSDTEAMYL